MDGDINVYISVEDAVTKAVVERLLGYCSPRLKVFKDIPARGGEIKNKISSLIKLSENKPVVVLIDLDNNGCAPALKSQLLHSEKTNADFIFNVAIDEAEAWLMADRENFSKYFHFPIDLIPCSSKSKMGEMKALQELCFPMKSSWVLTHEFMSHSTDSELKAQMVATGTASKGKEYNSAILPFIADFWDIDAASKESDSLRRMITRLNNLVARW